MKTGPLTAEEITAEIAYRFKERVNMMAPDGHPTDGQRKFARVAAMQEVALLNKSSS